MGEAEVLKAEAEKVAEDEKQGRKSAEERAAADQKAARAAEATLEHEKKAKEAAQQAVRSAKAALENEKKSAETLRNLQKIEHNKELDRINAKVAAAESLAQKREATVGNVLRGAGALVGGAAFGVAGAVGAAGTALVTLDTKKAGEVFDEFKQCGASTGGAVVGGTIGLVTLDPLGGLREGADAAMNNGWQEKSWTN